MSVGFCTSWKIELTYIGEDGAEHRPVVIHRAILGTSDRFISFLIEETKGNLPFWLCPKQVKILTIADRHIDYAKKIQEKLLKEKIRVEIDSRSEKIGYKIREAQLLKVPYMLIIGDKEIEENKVGVRSREDGDIGSMKIDEFMSKITLNRN